MDIVVKDGTVRVPYSDSFPLDLVEGISVVRVSTIEPIVTDGCLSFEIRWSRAYVRLFGEVTAADAGGNLLTTRKQAEEVEKTMLSRALGS